MMPGVAATKVRRGVDLGRRLRGRVGVELFKNRQFPAGTALALSTEMRPTPRLILLVFLLLQLFDGLLTYTAVAVLGVVGEGNVLLATTMNFIGAGPTLVAAKGLAAGCGLLLYIHRFYVVLGALTGLYLFGAIGPWLVVFHSL